MHPDSAKLLWDAQQAAQRISRFTVGKVKCRLTTIARIHIMRHIVFMRFNMRQTAKIFATGRSQAVRLPLEFRFDVAEVFIRHDPITGDVVLSRKPVDWQGLLDVVAQNKDEDFTLERHQTHTRRDPFEGMPE
jgi:antitoxin VapB